MVPVLNHDSAETLQADTPPLRAMTRHRYRPQSGQLPYDGEAILIAAGLLVGFVTIVVLLISTSKAVKAHTGDTAPVRSQLTNTAPAEIVQAASAPALNIEPAKVESAEKATPLLNSPNAKLNELALARREKALDLLKNARESQSDNVVYRQMLAELVRRYGETPAGAEALNLLAVPEPAGAVNATAEEKTEIQPAEEKSAPRAQYGLGFMN